MIHATRDLAHMCFARPLKCGRGGLGYGGVALGDHFSLKYTL